MTGRLERAILIAVCCGLTILISKSFHLPETAISAYLIFFAAREEAAESVLVALALCAAAVLAIGLAIVLIMATSGEPMLRIVAMFAIAFVAMYLAAATAAGVIAATLGMALFEVLSVMDFLPYPDLAQRGLFWLLPVVFVPMGILALANLIFGQDARSLLQKRRDRRNALIRSGETAQGRVDCGRELAWGNADFYKLLRVGRLAGTISHAKAQAWLMREDIAQRNLALCAAGRAPDLAKDQTVHALPPLKAPDGEADQDTGDALKFAVKATLAIAICYLIFVLLDWPAIHTITITAFLVALGSTAETLHKSALRLSGCLVGAAISGVCLLFIVPSLSSAAELAMLTAAVALPAAWIAVGPEKTSYAGMQIALVFLLSVANTAGPSVDLGIGWGRIVGIVLGNLVVAVVFLTLWPTNGLQRVAARLSRANNELASFLLEAGTRAPSIAGSGLKLGKVGQHLQTANDALEIAEFDPATAPKDLERLRRKADMLAAQLISVYAIKGGQSRSLGGS